MSDLLVELSQNAWFRKAIKNLGLPLPTPQKLKRPRGAMEERPLHDQAVAVVLPEGAQLSEVLAPVLTSAGANPYLVGLEATPAAWLQAGEAFGRPAKLFPVGEAPESLSVHAIVVDATGLSGPAELRALYDAFHHWLPRLRRCGRALVLGRPPESLTAPEAAAAAAGLEGFVRSLAKELGRQGATAHVAYVAPDADARLAGLLRFLLSDRSAFLTGQPWRLSSAVGEVEPAWVSPLAGKLALVTGAARGIGAATARALAAEGARVICLDRPGDEEPASRIAREIGGTLLAVDIAADDAPTAIAQFLKDQGQPLSVLIHNAGITRDKTLARMKPEHWDQVVAVNLRAVVAIDQALLAQDLLAKDARLVYLSSVSGLAGNVGQTAYSASKAGLAGYVRALARQLEGRAVNAVAPGFIETRLTQAIPVMTREIGRRLSALGQGGDPRDVADLILFLSTPGAALSGQVQRVCGGLFLGA